MKLLRNLLLVSSKVQNNTVSLGGVEIYLENKFGDGEHYSVFATVVEVGVQCKDVKVGDIVYHSYIHAFNAKDRGTMIDGKVLMTEDTVICMVRDGKIIMRENMLIVQPTEERIITTLIIPDSAKKISITEGVILETCDEAAFPKGATVNYDSYAWQPFEFELHATMYKKKNTVMVKADRVNLVYDKEA